MFNTSQTPPRIFLALDVYGEYRKTLCTISKHSCFSIMQAQNLSSCFYTETKMGESESNCLIFQLFLVHEKKRTDTAPFFMAAFSRTKFYMNSFCVHCERVKFSLLTVLQSGDLIHTRFRRLCLMNGHNVYRCRDCFHFV